MLVGSLAGPICAGGGFCAGSDEIVEHQRLSASSYTFSAALPAMLATTASEVLAMLETNTEMLTQVRDNVKTMWAQLDPRSEWVHCTSAAENPIMILVLKGEVVAGRKLNIREQEQLLQEMVDEVSQICSRAVSGAADSYLGVGQPGDDDEAEEHASRNQRHGQGSRMGASTSVEGLHHVGSHAQGD